MGRRLFRRYWIVLFIFIIISISAGADELVPKHLELGRSLLSQLSPETTSYRHNGWVRWKGDLFTSDYEAHTDCVGLINSLLERANCSMNRHLKLASSRGNPPNVEDYFYLISEQDGFKRIDTIADILPGDIIAVKSNVGSSVKSSFYDGHVMLVDAIPILRGQDTKPIIKGTRQWEVLIIDSAPGGHGKTDTRYREVEADRGGVGRGVLRLYSGENGIVIGYSWSTGAKSVYYDNTSRPLAIGRVLCYSSQATTGKNAQGTGVSR
jgi:hypothetical protein